MKWSKWEETKCATCQNAVPKLDGSRGCNWSREFKPVEGWEATPSRRRTKCYEIDSYCVTSCPEYIPDEPRKVADY